MHDEKEKALQLNRAVGGFKELVERQRKINDEQMSVRRATWDQYLETVTDVGEVQGLLKQLAVDAAAW